MHIAEGILTGHAALATTAAGAAVVAWGATQMNSFVKDEPMRKPLLGMFGAFIFFVSLIPLPAFTGTTTHPCGTPLAGILLGPAISCALAFLALLLQAAFFAHGGFSSLGANTIVLGLFGAGSGWLVFKMSRKAGLPLWASAGLGGLLGDLFTYAGTGLILGGHLSTLEGAKYSFSGYLAAIYAAYLPTQLPIAIGEMLVTGFAVHSIFRMRPEVLENLGVISKEQKGKSKGKALIGIALTFCWLGPALTAAETAPAAVAAAAAEQPAGFPGMDEAVNEKIAVESGAKPRDPYINFEAMGDLWNFVLMLGGGSAGFVMGRYWHILFERKQKKS